MAEKKSNRHVFADGRPDLFGVHLVEGRDQKVDRRFRRRGFLKGAIAKASGEHPAVQHWWAAFLKHGALPGVKLFNVLIPLGETLVGLGLLLGTFATLAALMGMVMNFAFLFSDSVSVNPQMILLEMILVAAAANAGRIGLDYWIMPYLRTLFSKKPTPSASTPHESI